MTDGIISNSEVDSFQRCPRAHYYGFGLALAPKEQSVPIKHGVIGHKALEAYYKAKKAELPHDECVMAGVKAIGEAPASSGDVLGMVMKRYLEYTDYYKDEPFRVLDVEGVYSVPMSDGITYALTLDLLMEHTSGSRKGEQVVMDTKWCYNFKTIDEVHMHPQIPKYIGALRMLGSTAKMGYYNMIRWREIKQYTPEQVFKRLPVEPTQTRINNIMTIQHHIARNEILPRRQMPKARWHDDYATPALHEQNCKNCFFRHPCSQELDGTDPTLTLAVNYESRRYGYSEDKLRRNA